MVDIFIHDKKCQIFMSQNVHTLKKSKNQNNNNNNNNNNDFDFINK